MKVLSVNRLLVTALVAVAGLFVAGSASAQFSQAVIVMRGTVVSTETGKPVSVKVSVRAASDTAQEITASRSNSSTGTYLVVLKPSHKYWVHLAGDQLMTKDTLIETPAAATTTQVMYDFAVETLEMQTPGAMQPTIVAKRQD